MTRESVVHIGQHMSDRIQALAYKVANNAPLAARRGDGLDEPERVKQSVREDGMQFQTEVKPCG